MAPAANELPQELQEVGELAVARAKKWVEASTHYPTDYAAKLLSRVLRDPGGLDFTVAFVDEVVRPEDLRVAANSLARLTETAPKFLPWYLRVPAKVGGLLATTMPEIVIPLARKVFAALVGDLVMDVRANKLGKAIAKLQAEGARLNMNLLGEAVLGDKEAKRRLDDTMELLQRDDVDYVSLKVSAVTGPSNRWAYDQVTEKAVNQLLPLYQYAAASPTRKFINLDMEEYHDLHLTIRVFKELLGRPEMKNLEAGIVLQAYLPDSLDAMKDLQEWAAKRRAEGGAPIKVRVVKGANLMMENVDAKMHGWELTCQPSKRNTDANYIRVLDYALTPEHTQNVRIGIAGMNIFTIAFGYELATRRGVLQSGGAEFEMLTGMAATMAQAVKEDVGPLLYYVPVVHPEEYDVAIAYLVRRLEENAAPENFMSAVFDIASNDQLLQRELQRFTSALEIAYSQPVGPRRKQNRQTETEEDIAKPVKTADGKWTFENTPDSDPALPANLQWARDIAARMEKSQLGVETIEAARVNDEGQLKGIIDEAVKAGAEWAARSPEERGEILHRAGVIMGRRRADLIEVAGSECGKALDQGDVEVSEGIDYAHYYAEEAIKMNQIPGAKFQPAKLTVVTPPWNFPFAIPAGSTIAALAAGSPVILKPATPAKRTGALLAECLWEAGVPREVLKLVRLKDHELGHQLITHPDVERVVLTGSLETAQMFRSWRPDLGLLAETSGKNSIIVTPSADLDLAVKDVVNSAFGHAGQKCSAASLVILVGTAATSKRFYRQLVDAVKSLHVAYPWDLATEMGPLCEEPGEKLLRGLTTLEPGQRWIVKPRRLDDSNKLWSPGVRAGVEPGSEYHLVEYFGPILGVIQCDTLAEAVEIQNQVEYGLTGGIHTLNPEEIQYWLDHVEIGNAYINRGITGAIVRRQSFGGWKRSVVGAGSKAGGPSYLYALGTWKRDAASAVQAMSEMGGPQVNSTLGKSVQAAAVAANLPQADRDLLSIGLACDEKAVSKEFGIMHDPSQLGVERNVFRYLPTPVLVRWGGKAEEWELLRVVAAGLAVKSQVSVSAGKEPSAAVRNFLSQVGVSCTVETEEAWLGGRAKAWADSAGYDGRIRLIGEDPKKLSEAVEGSVDIAIWSHEVTTAGRVEIVPFVHEQAIALTNHRFGDPTPITKDLLTGPVATV